MNMKALSAKFTRFNAMKIGISFLICSLLTGCVAAVLAGAAGGLIVYDKRSLILIEKDGRIFHKIHTTIITDPAFEDSHVVVTSFNENVLLVGQVQNTTLRAEAEKIAKTTPQVRRVYNELTVGNPTPYSQRSKDSLITGQIRAKMLAKKDLESGSIRIVTENSVVYLMGIVTRDQSNLAVDVARQTKGVTKVVKVFRYVT